MQGRCQSYLTFPIFSGSSAVIGHQDPIIRTCHRELKVISHCVLWLHKRHRDSREPQQPSHQAALWSETFQRWEIPTCTLLSQRTVKINTIGAQEKPTVSSGAGNGGGGDIGSLSESGLLSPQLPLSELPQSILAWVPSRTTSVGEPSTHCLSKNTRIIGKMSKPSSALF